MAKSMNPKELAINLTFPLAGLDESRAMGAQRQGTCADALNVRAFDPSSSRARGGRRPGLTRHFDAQVTGDTNSVQDINHLITNDGAVSGDPGSDVSPFLYTLATGGFGLASGLDGTSFFTKVPSAVASAKLDCSCWDVDGNLYVWMRNSTTIYVASFASDGTTRWEVTSAFDSTATRSCCGMVVIGTILYCQTNRLSGIAELYRIRTTDGFFMEFPWQKGAQYNANTNARNVLGACGTMLAIESASGCSLIIVNTLTGAVKVATYPGTANTSACSKVISDGNAFFYTIAGNSANNICKITTGGVIVWSSTAAGTPTSITLDTSLQYLLAVKATSKSLTRLSLVDGVKISDSDPGSITEWDEIDCDGKGFFTLWRNNQSSHDVIGLNTTLDVLWGPNTLANAVHRGASVDRASAPRPIGGASAIGTRQIRLLIVANGEAFLCDENGPISIDNGASFAAGANVVFSSQNGLNMYYVDGAVYRKYQSSTNSIVTWTTTAGVLPTDELTSACRLICTWRGRTVLAGLARDPQNYFMSRINDPEDWDYSPISTSEDQATSGNTGPIGFLGDIINCLIPYSDDLLIVGCDHTISQFTGDPMAGGSLDVISDTIGMAWGRPFCKDPYGRIYFMSSQCGVYMMAGPGSFPIRISSAIDHRLREVDLNSTVVRMAWDLDQQGFALFLTPVDPTKDTTNYFWEERTKAWFPDAYAEAAFNPMAVHAYDGDKPEDRVIMIGGRDGYVRRVDRAADDDDGEDMNSYVLMGPIMTPNLDELTLMDLQPIMAADSAPVDFSVYVGSSAEAAFNSDAVFQGTFGPGRGHVFPVQRAGHAIYIAIGNAKQWSLEVIRASLSQKGRTARRM